MFKMRSQSLKTAEAQGAYRFQVKFKFIFFPSNCGRLAQTFAKRSFKLKTHNTTKLLTSRHLHP